MSSMRPSGCLSSAVTPGPPGSPRRSPLSLNERDHLGPVLDHHVLAGKLIPQHALHLRLTDQQHMPAMIPVRASSTVPSSPPFR